MSLRSYAGGMDQLPTLEDSRGVDVGQIRDLLGLSVAERAAEMISVSNLIIEAQECARRARERAAG
jgi:hypothetical protein